MLSQVSEQKMHMVRGVLAIGWLLLILSLFYDPISHHLTDPDNFLSPFRDRTQCILVQGECLDLIDAYPMGARIFWGMIVPSGIMIVLVFGHETWRRICPLYFLSQIPRALGLQPRLKVREDSWLSQNHLYLQFGLFFLGLNFRILFVNSARPVLGMFLLLTIGSAITIVYLYGGRSWCHYVCPFGIVQMVFTGPRGLLGSEAHTAASGSLTQSTCRIVDSTTGQEKTACIGCKTPCMDIDAEKAYWQQLPKPGRKLVQYGYLGLVIGYFVYYELYAGNFNYYFSGAWTHEANQLATLFKPGFYILNQSIPIPKLVAVPLTLAAFAAMSCQICSKLEKASFSYLKRKHPNISRELVLHRVFSLCSFVAFNAFFIYGGRPEIMRLPALLQLAFQGFVVGVSTLWLYRTWDRSNEQYIKESFADKLRRQLKKLAIDFSKFLEGRSLDELKPSELHVLAKVLPNVTKQDRLQVYFGVLKEALEAGHANAASSLEVLRSMREKLGISSEEHNAALTEVGIEDPLLLDPREKLSRENQLRLESYRQALELLLLESIESGMALERALQLKSLQIQAYKRQYRITPPEHEQILAGMFDRESKLRHKAEVLLTQVQLWATRHQALKNLVPNPEATIFVLLRKLLLPKIEQVTAPLLSILELLGDRDPNVKHLAQRTGVLAHHVLPEMLRDPAAKWQERLSRELIHWLEPNLNATQIDSIDLTQVGTQIGNVPMRPEAVIDILMQVQQDANSLLQAASLYALHQLDPQLGRQQAQQLLSNQTDELVQETAQTILQPTEVKSTLEKLLRLLEMDLCKSLEPEILISLARNGQVRMCDRDQVICHQFPCPEIILLLKGEAQIQVTQNHLIHPIGTVSPGQIIGGNSKNVPETTLVVATASETIILAIAPSNFEELLHQHPLLAKKLIIGDL